MYFFLLKGYTPKGIKATSSIDEAQLYVWWFFNDLLFAFNSVLVRAMTKVKMSSCMKRAVASKYYSDPSHLTFVKKERWTW